MKPFALAIAQERRTARIASGETMGTICAAVRRSGGRVIGAYLAAAATSSSPSLVASARIAGRSDLNLAVSSSVL